MGGNAKSESVETLSERLRLIESQLRDNISDGVELHLEVWREMDRLQRTSYDVDLFCELKRIYDSMDTWMEMAIAPSREPQVEMLTGKVKHQATNSRLAVEFRNRSEQLKAKIHKNLASVIQFDEELNRCLGRDKGVGEVMRRAVESRSRFELTKIDRCVRWITSNVPQKLWERVKKLV